MIEDALNEIECIPPEVKNSSAVLGVGWKSIVPRISGN
jgi:hypothetical protein